jgi:hypothetical protein
MAFPYSSDPADFGLPKSNYNPVVDPTTDLDYAEYERCACACAAMTVSAFRAHIAVSAASTTAATTGTMVKAHSAVWGDTLAVRPTVARTATGAYTVTWAASYVDNNPTPSRQTSGAVSFTVAQATAQTPPAGYVLCCAMATVAANVATVQTAGITTAGTAVAVDCDFALSVR